MFQSLKVHFPRIESGPVMELGARQKEHEEVFESQFAWRLSVWVACCMGSRWWVSDHGQISLFLPHIYIYTIIILLSISFFCFVYIAPWGLMLNVFVHCAMTIKRIQFNGLPSPACLNAPAWTCPLGQTHRKRPQYKSNGFSFWWPTFPAAHLEKTLWSSSF